MFPYRRNAKHRPSKSLSFDPVQVVSELNGNAGFAIRTPRMRSVRSPYTCTGYTVREIQRNTKEKKYLHEVNTFRSFPFLELSLHDLTHCHQSAIEGNNAH